MLPIASKAKNSWTLRTARAPIYRTLAALVAALEPGLTSREPDDLGRGLPRDADVCSGRSPERQLCTPP